MRVATKQIGRATAEKLRLADERGGWRAAGLEVGKVGNRVPALIGAGLMTYDQGKRDYVVTAAGRRFYDKAAAGSSQGRGIRRGG